MEKINKLLTTAVVAMLLLAIPAICIPAHAQGETVTTDKGLYVIKYTTNSTGYVQVRVTMTGLNALDMYKVVVSRLNGPIYASVEGTLPNLGNGDLTFILPGTMDARPTDLAGTWNVTLYKKVGDQYQIAAYTNFGVWGINSKLLNYGRILQVFGGGFDPNTKVSFTILNVSDTSKQITSVLYGQDPAVCKVSNLPDATYGRFSNSSVPIPKASVTKGKYNVTLMSFAMLPKAASVYEKTVLFNVTDRLLVNIINPPANAQFNRTQTINVEAEVLYMDYEPVTTGTVTATFDLPSTGSSPYNNDKNIPLTYDPVSKTWKGSLKIQYNNVTGQWGITVNAADNYGNTGSDSETIRVYPGVLVVSTVSNPAANVPRASWVTWQVKVTYKGDGSLADLNIPACTVYVVNASTNAIVGAAYITKISTGYYNISWFVPADAPYGSYKFMIPKNALQDTVTSPEGPNVGPEQTVYSAPFTVGVTSLNVVADTYPYKGAATTQKSFTPGATVWIGASVTYKDSGVVMSSGTVLAYIYNSTGALIATGMMSFDSASRMWWCSWDSTGAKAGRYDVIVNAKDIGNNVGQGTTYFLIAGMTLTPSSGTVPPETSVKATKLDTAGTKYLVSASIYTDAKSGKSLGTTVTLTGTAFTPNSKVNVTVSGLPYLTGKTVYLALNVPTDASGAFTCSFVFPVAPNGTYIITATDAVGVIKTATFTVKPGLILTPGQVTGSALINVIATGYPASATGRAMLVNGTDALYPIVSSQITSWSTNANGTLTAANEWGLTPPAKPAFTMPYMEPGVYSVTLYCNISVKIAKAVDTVIVVSQVGTLISKLDDLTSLVKAVNVTLVSVSGKVATLVTDSGVIKADTATLKTMLTKMNATLVSVNSGVATISTSIGTIKASVDALSPKIDSISSNVATISTSIGTVKSSVDALSPTVTSINDKVATIQTTLGTLSGTVESIDGNVATVKTDVGTIKADVSSLKSTVSDVQSTVSGVPAAVSNVNLAVWVAVIMSLIAAIGSIVSLVLLRKKIA